MRAVSTLVLPLVALLFIWAAVRRYRGDRAATVAGVAAGLGGTLGIALTLPAVNLTLPIWGLVVAGGAAIVVAVAGSLYAEVRRNRTVSSTSDPNP